MESEEFWGGLGNSRFKMRPQFSNYAAHHCQPVMRNVKRAASNEQGAGVK